MTKTLYDEHFADGLKAYIELCLALKEYLIKNNIIIKNQDNFLTLTINVFQKENNDISFSYPSINDLTFNHTIKSE